MALDDWKINIGLERFVQIIRRYVQGDVLNDLDNLSIAVARHLYGAKISTLLQPAIF